MTRASWLFVITLCVGGAAAAQNQPPTRPGGAAQGWSVNSAQTVGDGATVISAAAGWPGVPVTLLYGLAPNIDFGGRFTFNYAYEGMVNDVFTGTKLQAVIRLRLLDLNVVKVGMSLEPGVLAYFPNANATPIVGLALPVNFVMGFPMGSNLLINVALDFPMWMTFSNYSSFNVPITFGGGAEYFFNSNLELTAELQIGPAIASTPFDNQSDVQFAPKLLVGVAYKL